MILQYYDNQILIVFKYNALNKITIKNVYPNWFSLHTHIQKTFQKNAIKNSNECLSLITLEKDDEELVKKWPIYYHSNFPDEELKKYNEPKSR